MRDNEYILLYTPINESICSGYHDHNKLFINKYLQTSMENKILIF